MFKATTRRVKGDLSATLAGIKYERFIHEAQPASGVDAEGGFTALLPQVRGGAGPAYDMARPFKSQEEAVAFSRSRMIADGWRETREEAEQDAVEEIDRRTNYRADGKPRFKV